MSETWKFNGTLSKVPAISGGTAVAISGKAYLNDTLYETFTQLYYNDTSKYLEIGSAGYWDGINNKYGLANILVFDTAPTGTLLTFLQTYATKQ